MQKLIHRYPALRGLGVVGILGLAALSLLGLTQGIHATEKVVTQLLMPCGLCWCALTGALVSTLTKAQKRRSGEILLLGAAWMLYTAAGNGLIADQWARSLEARYASIQPLEEPLPFDALVILGGDSHTGANGRPQGGDRLTLAAQLYHRGLARELICTGSKIAALDSETLGPGEKSAHVLQGLGVPENLITLLPGRNTAEEMVSLGQRFGSGDRRVGLITSAWHLPRAMRLAAKHGFHPLPLPSDFISGELQGVPIATALMECIPNGLAFRRTARITVEYLAALVGR
jgi:uncharacterized SAM-binding protein YcdF (DUF218 family)